MPPDRTADIRGSGVSQEGYPVGDALLSLIARRCLALLLTITLTMAIAACNREPQKYSDVFDGSFDTVVQLIAFAPSKSVFDRWFDRTERRFRELHQLFDTYHAYPGVNNLFTVNAAAGKEPVVVDPEIIRLLLEYREKDRLAPGVVNPALGPVLEIWHSYREEADGGEGRLPGAEELKKAAAHSDFAQVRIDPDNNTVFLPDPGMRLDVGAVAKGYATELVARELIEAGLTSGLLSAGGSNVKLIGKPLDGRDRWSIGLQSPDGNPLIPDEAPLDVILARDQSVVTSGDYQRYYRVGGVMYAHLIDPKTLFPARYFRAVTVVTPDSGLADYLSTALFLIPEAQGRQLIARFTDVEALWIYPDRRIVATEGMRRMLKSQQPATSAPTSR